MSRRRWHILLLLQEKGAHIAYHDPHVPVFRHNVLEMASAPNLEAVLAEADCVVIAADHSGYDWASVHRRAHLVVDTRATLRQMQSVTVGDQTR